MKTIKFNVLKKNRKYFAATLTSGAKCRILIDQNSDSLEIGHHELMVDDISVRSKYGTDLIFKLHAEASEQEQAGVVTLKHFKYNKTLLEKCKLLGGKWDADEQAWIFSDLVQDEVEELDDIYNSNLVNVEIKALDDLYAYHTGMTFLGYGLAKATGRDSGAALSEDISLIEGTITSGGSMKNWATVVREDAVIRMKIPESLIENFESEDWKLKKI